MLCVGMCVCACVCVCVCVRVQERLAAKDRDHEKVGDTPTHPPPHNHHALTTNEPPADHDRGANHRAETPTHVHPCLPVCVWGVCVCVCVCVCV
jgi:hypothetical protein